MPGTLMTFMRLILGLAVAGIGFVAAIVMLMVFFLFFPADDTLAVRLGWAVILALVEGGIFFGTFYAFRKVKGPTSLPTMMAGRGKR
jgi:hypothetical protein